jgi:hypothetical protein
MTAHSLTTEESSFDNISLDASDKDIDAVPVPYAVPPCGDLETMRGDHATLPSLAKLSTRDKCKVWASTHENEAQSEDFGLGQGSLANHWPRRPLDHADMEDASSNRFSKLVLGWRIIRFF